MWKTVFFLRIWRSWLSENGYDLKEHFITENAYACIELTLFPMGGGGHVPPPPPPLLNFSKNLGKY